MVNTTARTELVHKTPYASVETTLIDLSELSPERETPSGTGDCIEAPSGIGECTIITTPVKTPHTTFFLEAEQSPSSAKSLKADPIWTPSKHLDMLTEDCINEDCIEEDSVK